MNRISNKGFPGVLSPGKPAFAYIPMKKIFSTIFLAHCCCFALWAQGQRWHVRADASGQNSGLSWADAFPDLQAALQMAQEGDSIWVAHGTYLPTAAADRSISFELPSGVVLLGGFVGTETSPAQRDLSVLNTVLSGDIGTPGDSTDNSHNIMYMADPDSTTLLEGFVFRFGNANSTDPAAPSRSRKKCGGAIYMDGKDGIAYPTIRYCRFERNASLNYGGAVMVLGDGDGSVAPQFLHCTFERNSTGLDGGGIARFGGSWKESLPDFAECKFLNNQSGRNGGGIYYQDSERTDSLEVINCSFVQNSAGEFGGGMDLRMGRFFGSQLCVEGCFFAKNRALNPCAMSVSNNFVQFMRNFVCKKSTFQEHGDNADLMRVDAFTINDYEGQFLIEDCSIINNDVGGGLLKGGPVFPVFSINKLKVYNNIMGRLWESSGRKNTIISNCIIENNTLFDVFVPPLRLNDISNLSISSNNLSHLLSKSPNVQTNPTVYKNCIFVGNKRTTSNYTSKNWSYEFVNCIIETDPIQLEIADMSCRLILSYNWLDGFNCDMPPTNKFCGPGNLFGLDPMFVDTAAGDYRLRPCSPLVNAGTNTAVSPGDTDLDGRPRILGGTVDIGPYEMPGIALTAAPDVRGSCAGGTAGAATFSVMDACVPVSYVWSAASGGSGSGAGLQASGLAPGDYTFTLTDAKGFSDTLALTVPEAAPPGLAAVATPVVCGDTLGGAATAVVSGAAPPLAFAWAGGSTDSLLQNLPPGQYTLTVTDAFGCSNSLTINVERTGNLGILPDVSPISCFGETDGSISVAPADGRPPFVFQWQNGPGAPTWAMLGPGVYEGTVTDAFGCTAAWTFPLAAPDRLLASAQVADASGPANPDGGIVISQIEGGTPPYTAAWSNGASGLVNAALLPGQYVLTLTDGRGCVFQDTFLVGYIIGTSEAEGRAFRLFVSPNPSGDAAFASFELAENQDVSLVVADLLGRPLRTVLAQTRRAAGPHTERLDLAGLPAGVYLVQLRGAAATGVVRVVKQ